MILGKKNVSKDYIDCTEKFVNTRAISFGYIALKIAVKIMKM